MRDRQLFGTLGELLRIRKTGGVIHVWHSGPEHVGAVIAICNLLLAISGCFILASLSDASHTGPPD